MEYPDWAPKILCDYHQVFANSPSSRFQADTKLLEGLITQEKMEQAWKTMAQYAPDKKDWEIDIFFGCMSAKKNADFSQLPPDHYKHLTRVLTKAINAISASESDQSVFLGFPDSLAQQLARLEDPDDHDLSKRSASEILWTITQRHLPSVEKPQNTLEKRFPDAPSIIDLLQFVVSQVQKKDKEAFESAGYTIHSGDATAYQRVFVRALGDSFRKLFGRELRGTLAKVATATIGSEVTENYVRETLRSDRSSKDLF